MPRLSDLLYRLRPSGAPGSATTAGVPVDRRRDAALELGPVFAGVAETEQACERIVADAREQAARIRAHDAARAKRIAAAAAARLAGERAAAADRVRGEGDAHRAVIDAEADRKILAMRSRLEVLLPTYRDAFAVALRALLDEGAPAAGVTRSPTPAAQENP